VLNSSKLTELLLARVNTSTATTLPLSFPHRNQNLPRGFYISADRTHVYSLNISSASAAPPIATFTLRVVFFCLNGAELANPLLIHLIAGLSLLDTKGNLA
jgi:hypothetical protein